MKLRKFLYTFLLVLFSLILVADIALYLFIPERSGPVSSSDMPFPGGTEGLPSFSFENEDGSGFSFSRPDGKSLDNPFANGENPFADGNSSFSAGENPFSESERSSSGDADSRPRRPRSGSEESSSGKSILFDGWTSVLDELPEESPLRKAFTVAQTIRPYWLWILIGSALGMILCIIRLIFLARKSRKNREQQAAEAGEDAIPPHRKQAVWPAVLILLAALVLVAVLFPAQSETASNDAVAMSEVLSGTVQKGTIERALVSTGYLEEQEPVEVTLPASVKLTAVTVRNGDSVEKGQIIAKVNKTSVMTAVASVQEAIADIETSLKTAMSSTGSTTLSAATSGTVKKVYCKTGDKVSDVMAKYGSLMLLSLDGRMSVDLPAQEGLNAGSKLKVALTSGKTVNGTVTDLTDDIVTVSIYDNNYAVGESVSVYDSEGTLLGSGELRVHRPMNITAFLGTVSRVYRTAGTAVQFGTTLITLKDTSDSAEVLTLLEMKADYEEELKKLFELYQNEFVVSPEDGVVSGVSDDLTFQEVSRMFGEDSVIRFAGTSPEDSTPADYVHYVGQVTGNSNGMLYLNISKNTVQVTDYTACASLSGILMTSEGSYSLPSSAPVYTYSSGSWRTMSASSIAAGDLLVFTFDENGTLVWVICCPGAAPTPTPTPTLTPTPTPDPDATPRPSADPSGDTSPSPLPSGSGFPGGGGGRIRFPSSGKGSAAVKETYQIVEQTLLSVTPQETMTVSATVDELDVLSLSEGQVVKLYLDALSGTSFSGTITEIDPEGVNSGGNTKYTVKIQVPRTKQMLAGMNTTAVVSSAVREKVLTVPVAALNENGNTVTVYRGYDTDSDTLLDPVTVTTGLSDGDNVEILSGLKEGDPYYYRYAESISYETGSGS